MLVSSLVDVGCPGVWCGNVKVLDRSTGFDSSHSLSCNDSGQVVHTHTIVVKWYSCGTSGLVVCSGLVDGGITGSRLRWSILT